MSLASWLRTLRSRLETPSARKVRKRTRRKEQSFCRPCFEELETRALPSTVTWTNPAGGDWDNGANWNTGNVPGPGDYVVIQLAGITVTHSAATAESIGTLFSTDNIDWQNGSLTLANGTDYGDFDNAGTVTTQGDLYVGGGQSPGSYVVGAGATLTLAGTQALTNISGQGSVSFDDGTATVAGTYKLAGPGSTSVYADSVDFSGTVQGVGPELDVTGGASANFHSTALTLQNLTLAGTLNAGNVTVSNEFDWNYGTFAGPGTTTIGANAQMMWSTGNPQSTLDGRSLDNYGTIHMLGSSSGAVVLTDGASIDNYNIFQADNTISNGGNIRIMASDTAESFINNGTLIQAGNGITVISPVLTNTGTIAANAGELGFGDFSGTSDGLGMSVATGATLGFEGSFTIHDNITVAATGSFISYGDQTLTGNISGQGQVTFQFGTQTVSGTYNLSGANATTYLYDDSADFSGTALGVGSALTVTSSTANFHGSAFAVQTLTLSGTLTAGSVTVGQTFNWVYGTFAGPGTTTISSTATMTISNTSGLLYDSLQSQALNNYGTMVLGPYAGGLQLSGGATIDNYGSVQGKEQANVGFSITGAGTGGVFRNDGNGTFTQVTSGATLFYTVPFNNNSVNSLAVEVQAGSLALDDGGTSSGNFKVDAGAELQGNGTFSGTFTGAAGSLLDFNDSGSVATTLQPSAQVVSAGTVQFAGGTLNLPFTSAASGIHFASISASTVNLSAALNITLVSPLPAYLGETFTLVNNTGSSPINGTFAGLAQGATLTLSDGTQFQISYQGVAGADGIGNDVVLTTTAVSTGIGVTIEGDVYVLNQTASGALTLSGNAVLDVAGVLQVDSSSAAAVSLSGHADVNAARTLIVGGDQVSGNALFNNTPVTHAADVADPLAGLTGPTGGTTQTAVNLSTGTLTLNPGVYSSVTVSGNAHLILNPGVYSVGSGGITISGTATVTTTTAVGGQGVLIYNAGALTVSGNASVNLTAYSTGQYAGLAIFQAPNNASGVTISGNANVNLNGALLYAANVQCVVNISGNAGLEASLVVNELTIAGNADDTAP